ncbi:glycosyltransferase family 2 protein [Candidatus Daviesbacteria bacterium]|nr:glycosyltransferase family 2 protein [Candidatus Daviesbacteria bacterium]
MNYLNIIIPVKNEEENITPLVKRIDSSMSSKGIDYTIIFVDDRSEDQTTETILNLQRFYPVKLVTKKGKAGKAYSIIEGAQFAVGDNLAMIDGDLQYPPEVIPAMFAKLSEHGVVVANRIDYQDKPFRKFLNAGFKNIFGNFLFGLDCDVQSGLKLFKKEVIENVDQNTLSPWTLDLLLLLTARELGYSIGTIGIKFDKRLNGASNINVFKTIVEIGTNSLKHKFSKRKIYKILPQAVTTMVGAGLAYKSKRYITHTTLNHKSSAFKTFSANQALFFVLLIGILLIGFALNWLLALQVLIGILSVVYFIDVLFSLFFNYQKFLRSS